MERTEVYAVIDHERAYQDSNKDKVDSHIVSDFPLGSALLAIEEILNEARNSWYYEKDPYPVTMNFVRKIAAISVQMGERYGMQRRKTISDVKYL